MYSDITNRIVTKANLGLDSDTTDQTSAFLVQKIGNLREDQQQYQVLAAVAIVGQVKRIINVSRQGCVRSGISIEGVMRHIGKLSKEMFLEVLNRQYKKWREAPQWLQTKIDNVELSYRIYKKYRITFQQLCSKNNNLSENALFNLMAIFWVLYLHVKNLNPDIDNTDQAISLLYALFLLFFNEIIDNIAPSQIEIKFKESFSQSSPLNQEQYSRYRNSLIEKLNQVHAWRYQNSRINLEHLVTDENYAQRYLDDISNLYDKFKAQLPQNHVDEISFLELKKTLTPLTIKRNLNLKDAIMKKIDFDNDEDDDCESNDNNCYVMDPQSQENIIDITNNQAYKGLSTPLKPPKFEPVSPFQPKGVCRGNLTPIAARQQNLSWVNKIIGKFYEKQIETMKLIYQKYTNRQYSKYEYAALEKIRASIRQFTPECMDHQKRQKSIMVFFIHFVCKIVETHSQMENLLIFNAESSFNSLLCLSTYLFNYAYQALQGSYRRYTTIFQISLIEGHKPINWFGSNAQIPKNIETILYDLEKKILIFEIWQDSLGYSLICKGDNEFYHNQAIVRRLRKHVDERTQQLCNRMNISDKQVMRIINLVRFILNNRQVLLHKQKIDQILVCCIASILSINRSANNVSLQEVFDHYNTLNYSFYTNRSLEDDEGNKIDLNDYYNNIFLPAIEEIISKEENISNILSTPVQLEHRNRRERGLQMTPFSIKFRQTPTLGEKKFKSDSSDNNPYIYRKKIVNSLKNLNIEENEEEDNDDDFPSPCFGGASGGAVPQVLFKTFSFGNFDKF